MLNFLTLHVDLMWPGQARWCIVCAIELIVSDTDLVQRAPGGDVIGPGALIYGNNVCHWLIDDS